VHQVDPTWLTRWLAVLARHVKRASAAGVRAALAEIHSAIEQEADEATAVIAR